MVDDAYIHATPEAGAAFVRGGVGGPVTMLNLLRFRETADYSAWPALTPDAPISGAEAYERYMAHTRPFLDRLGAEVLYDGAGGPFLVGPPGAGWDRVLLVRHASVQTFLSMAADDEYIAGVGHRTAALRDSRLLPLVDR